MKVTITATAPTVLYGETWLTAGWITELRIFAGARIYLYEIFMTVEIYIMDFCISVPANSDLPYPYVHNYLL